MTRRDLFKALSAVFAAPLAEKLSAALPLPIPQTRFWEGGLRFTGFKMAQSTLDVCGQILGVRSDDHQDFYVCVTLRDEQMRGMSEDARTEYIRTKLYYGMLKMETFIDPRCTCSSRIIGYTRFVDEDGIYGDPGHSVRVPAHPHCEQHLSPFENVRDILSAKEEAA